MRVTVKVGKDVVWRGEALSVVWDDGGRVGVGHQGRLEPANTQSDVYLEITPDPVNLKPTAGQVGIDGEIVE